MRSLTMNCRASVSIYILSQVSFAFSLPLIYLWSCAWQYKRNSDCVNISTTSSSAFGRKPALTKIVLLLVEARAALTKGCAFPWSPSLLVSSAYSESFRLLLPSPPCQAWQGWHSWQTDDSMYSSSCGSCPESGSDDGEGWADKHCISLYLPDGTLFPILKSIYFTFKKDLSILK